MKRSHADWNTDCLHHQMGHYRLGRPRSSALLSWWILPCSEKDEEGSASPEISPSRHIIFSTMDLD